jgi:3-deoxy-D-manno-octulosonic-acid transferase
VQLFKDSKPLFIAGSTWHEDERIIADLIKQGLTSNPSPKERGDGMKYVIVPHEITHHHIGALEYLLIEKAGLTPDDIALYSRPEDDLQKAQVLIIDTIGLLSAVYHYGDIAYIGGGFGKGIHNVLEAAVYGMPVMFGPKHQKFNEAVGLINAGAANTISSSLELTALVKKYSDDLPERENTGALAKKYVVDHAGATEKILQHLQKTNPSV